MEQTTPDQLASRYKGRDLAPELDIQVRVFIILSIFILPQQKTAIPGESARRR